MQWQRVVGNLLTKSWGVSESDMNLCAVCNQSLAPEWKFCVYCGWRVTESATTDNAQVTAAIRTGIADKDAADQMVAPRRSLRYHLPFWVAVAMCVTGLVVIIYVVIQMATTNV